MKTSKKITRIKLDSEDNKNYSFILGIVSAEPDYKVSLALNRKLNISLRISTPYEMHTGTGKVADFGRFTDSSGMPDSYHALVSNRSGKNILSKKFSRIDYFFSVFHSFPSGDINLIGRKIKDAEGVTAVFPIKPDEIDPEIFQFL